MSVCAAEEQIGPSSWDGQKRLNATMEIECNSERIINHCRLVALLQERKRVGAVGAETAPGTPPPPAGAPASLRHPLWPN